VAVLIASCASTLRVYEEALTKTASARYSVLFMIHGDANYVFHDTVGIAHFANEEALAKAHTVAQQNPEAEVFIFHDRPKSNAFLFFPQRDGDFFYYRNGRLAATHSYWRDEGVSRFATQAALYNQFSITGTPGTTDTSNMSGADARTSDSVVRMFVYFGHEIPEVEGLHYDASYPDSTLTIKKFSKDFQVFTANTKPFDLGVLSTCFNGTPYSVSSFAPYTRYLIASPTNVHLSYFDMAPLEHLERSLSNSDVHNFARKVATHAFNKLSSDVQTVVSVVLYDIQAVEQYVTSVNDAYMSSLLAIQSAPTLTLAHCDCADQAPFASPLMKNGVEVLYRPAQFGRDANKLQHSGWACWKLSK